MSEAALNLLSLTLLTTFCPQVEKERELELREKLDEQRRTLEEEHEDALQGKDGDASLGFCPFWTLNTWNHTICDPHV